ncbi:glycosyltransferase family 2 protein [Polynucleobacter sp. MG-6-Vaara-E2]|uniref:glycosyltransferase family 2 protein n=1 Tax=Polynucleobacter sp. MG-6-Vaara-E2 TaxID=2576932 RepID=UPI001BFDA989|nr:glycosyltransferase family 2 protein [Polynucleobacter sp. MG-6-Vaara-E2]QWD96918.1 glycosyltransferase family 2 protein [Polynucleobacter sp. MG-6-Vaara-E2]
MNKNVLVSVFIAAYDNPSYTRKTIQSIIDQSYRPIEILLCDDCSPNSLEILMQEFKEFQSPDLIIKYFRHDKNIRGLDNMIFGFDQCSGKYGVNIQHDEWWIDCNFLSETVDIMEKDPECNLCIGNAYEEDNIGIKMLNIPNKYIINKWNTLTGEEYINILGSDGMGYPPWSSVIFNVPNLRKLGGFHYPYNLPKSYADKLGILPDEFFASQFLLSSIGNVALSDNIISIRGRPENSFTLSNNDWHKCVGQAAFVIHYNLMTSNHKGIYIKAMKKRAKKMLILYPVERINVKILEILNFDKEMKKMYYISYLYFIFRKFNYYIRNIKKIIKIQKEKGFKNTIIYVLNRIKSKGFISAIFQIK